MIWPRLTSNFSRIARPTFVRASSTVAPLSPSVPRARISLPGTVATLPWGDASKALAACPAKFWKDSFLLTKSVSQFTSTRAALVPDSFVATPTSPSVAVRLDFFFSAWAMPLFLRTMCAFSMSQPDSSSAALTSVTGAELSSLNCLINCKFDPAPDARLLSKTNPSSGRRSNTPCTDLALDATDSFTPLHPPTPGSAFVANLLNTLTAAILFPSSQTMFDQSFDRERKRKRRRRGSTSSSNASIEVLQSKENALPFAYALSALSIADFAFCW
mmetsp:Transcript_3963/g.11519  ORF Transcript_3963/g.11519 Transcript_3963/m.11519 type:complete len:273 (-) Transcript_3963:202-1020(-)